MKVVVFLLCVACSYSVIARGTRYQYPSHITEQRLAKEAKRLKKEQEKMAKLIQESVDSIVTSGKK